MSDRIRLDVIDVPEPCPEDWEGMRGDDRVRFCGTCSQNVYHLSAMSRPEAEALIEEHEGRLCVRFYRRADGTVTTTDCAPERFAAMRRRAKRSLAFAAVAAAGLMTLVGAVGAATALGVFAEEIIEPDPMPLAGAVAPLPEYEPPPEPEVVVDTDEAADQIVPPAEASE